MEKNFKPLPARLIFRVSGGGFDIKSETKTITVGEINPEVDKAVLGELVFYFEALLSLTIQKETIFALEYPIPRIVPEV